MLLQQCSRQAKQLTLPSAEVLALLRNLRFQILEDVYIGLLSVDRNDRLGREETSSSKCVEDLIVLILVEGIERAAKRAGQDSLKPTSVNA